MKVQIVQTLKHRPSGSIKHELLLAGTVLEDDPLNFPECVRSALRSARTDIVRDISGMYVPPSEKSSGNDVISPRPQVDRIPEGALSPEDIASKMVVSQEKANMHHAAIQDKTEKAQKAYKAEVNAKRREKDQKKREADNKIVAAVEKKEPKSKLPGRRKITKKDK